MPASPLDPEDALFAAAAAGDPDALDRLLGSYLPELHAFVRSRLGSLRRSEESGDVVQSVCRQLIASRQKFEFRGEGPFRAWLFTTALNKIREKHRFHHLGKRDLGRVRGDLDPGALPAPDLATPSQEAVGNELGMHLAAALAALPDEQREVISLARTVGLPHRVIAELMDRSEGAVRQLLGRALARVADELRRRGFELPGDAGS
jgi:RNA polymerase sigma-70 factor, ECF subfamily